LNDELFNHLCAKDNLSTKRLRHAFQKLRLSLVQRYLNSSSFELYSALKAASLIACLCCPNHSFRFRSVPVLFMVSYVAEFDKRREHALKRKQLAPDASPDPPLTNVPIENSPTPIRFRKAQNSLPGGEKDCQYTTV